MFRPALRDFLAHLFSPAMQARRSTQRPSHCRPALEVLEARLSPAISLTISTPLPFAKPDSGQMLGMFVVTRSGNLSPAVDVDYATRDGSGADGARAGVDYVATAGTLHFTQGQTTAMISVPVLGNNVFQPDKTFTVDLTHPREPAEVTFTAPEGFSTGRSPRMVAVGDFNGDGKPDLVVVNQDDTVSVLLNTTPTGAASPTFALPQTFPTGTDPRSVAVGDINGDGKPDLVVANYGSNTVSVLLNTTPATATTPTFAPQQTFPTGSRPRSVAVGDINGDGKPDLVVANQGSDTVSVLLNTTPTGADTPTFAPQQTFSVGAGPASVALGDFNGDGKPDLAVACTRSGAVSVLLNTTPTGADTPTFAPQQAFPAGSPVSVVVADINGDGKPDLALVNSGSSMSVLLNTTPTGATTPSFAPQQQFPGVGGVSLAVGDFNGDGRPDLAVANSGNQNVAVLLNTTPTGAATASFVFAGTVNVGPGPLSVAAADFNGDGGPDLAVVTSYLSVALDVLPLISSGTATGTIQATLQTPTAVTVVPGTSPQSAVVGSAFAAPLAVDVRDSAGTLVQGVSVTFTAPASGPGGSFGSGTSVTVVTDASGRTTAPVFVAGTMAGDYTVTAQAAGGGNPDTAFDLTNNPGAASTFHLDVPAAAVAGGTFTCQLTALDPHGNVAAGYRGTVTFTLSDPRGLGPADYTFTAADAGTQAFGAVFLTAGPQTLSVRDTADGSLTASVPVAVTAAAPSQLRLVAPATVAAGLPFSFTISARDRFGNLAPDYRGTVHLSSSDGTDVGADYTFTAGDAGQHVFSAALPTVGVITLTATEVAAGWTASAVVNVAEPAVGFLLTGVPAEVSAGQPFAVTVQAIDQFGNPTPGYTGTVSVSSDDPQGNTLSHTFVTEDAGRFTFTGLVLDTAGPVNLFAGDGTLLGTATTTVAPGQATHLVLFPPDGATAGAPFSLTVAAYDAWGNVATGYTGTVGLTSDDPLVPALGSHTFTDSDGGTYTFTGLGLETARTTTLRAGDGGVFGSAVVTVHPGTAAWLQVLAPPVVRAGQPFSLTVVALDLHGNVATDYAGTVHFSSSDGTASLPADYTFGPDDQGRHTWDGLALYALGGQQMTVTDLEDPTIFGSWNLNVLGG